MCRKPLAALVTLLVVNVEPAFSSAIWNNGSPNGVDEWLINQGVVEADDFNLSTAASVTQVTFSAGTAVNAPVIALSYRLYSSVGLPGAIIEQGAAQNLVSTPDGTVECCGSFRFSTSFDIAPVSLPPGTYWLALYDASNGTSFRVFWGTTADRLDTNGFAQAFEPNFAFTVIGASGPFGRDLSFSLQDVPEPSMAILSFLGIMLMAALWRTVPRRRVNGELTRSTAIGVWYKATVPAVMPAAIAQIHIWKF